RALSNRASLNQLQYPHSAAQAAKTDVGWSHSRERYTSARELVSYRGGLKSFRLDDKETCQCLSESQRAGYVSAGLVNLTWDPAPAWSPAQTASTEPMVSASAAGLSGRYRSTRAKRSATPPGYLGLPWTPSKATSTTSSGRTHTTPHPPPHP